MNSNSNQNQKPDKYIPHRRSSLEDLTWVLQQDPCVQQLWIACITAEGFGDAFREVKTTLSEKSFRKAKKVLENVLFEFEAIFGLSSSGRSLVLGWKVRNLHGWHNTRYWLASTHQTASSPPELIPADREVLPDERESFPSKRETLPPEREILPEETAVAFDTTAFDFSPMTNSKNKENNNNQLKDVAVFSSFVSGEQHSAPTSSESGASRLQEVTESANAGASRNAEDNRKGSRNEPCRPSMELENEHRREEAKSTHQQKSSAPSRIVLRQNDVHSQEMSLDAPVKSFAPAPRQSANEHIHPALRPLQEPIRKLMGEFCIYLAERGKETEALALLESKSIMKLVSESEVEVVNNAILATQQKLPTIQNLSAYFRKAITERYKLSQAKAEPKQRERGYEEAIREAYPVPEGADMSKPYWFLTEKEWTAIRESELEGVWRDKYMALIHPKQNPDMRIGLINRIEGEQRLARIQAAKVAEAQKPVDPDLGF